MEREGAIRRLEVTFGLAWKTLKDYLEETGIVVNPVTPRSVIKEAFAAKLLDEGIYVIGFYFPVVAKGQARIRVQLSAAHDQHHLDKAIAAFTKVGKELGVLK